MTARSTSKRPGPRRRAAVLRRPLVVCVGADADTRALAAALERAGADAPVLEPNGGLDGVGVECGGDATRAAILGRGRALHDADAVVLRQLPSAPLEPDVEAISRSQLRALADRIAAARERSALARSALLALDDGRRPFFHPLATVELHLHKPLALLRLARAGVPVPASLATADANEARRFVERVRAAGDEVIYKPVAGGALARRFLDDDLARLPSLVHAPALLQRRVRARDDLEHRVYLLDDAPLMTFALPTTAVTDARLRVEEARRVRCPRAVAIVARAAARALGLPFCAVDVRLDADERRGSGAVVLDVNPTPSLLDYPDDGALAERLAAFVMRRIRAQRA